MSECPHPTPLDAIYATSGLCSLPFNMISLKYTALLVVLVSCLTFGACNKRDVIVDTDAGADDALAILMLLSPISPVNVVAITCVTGNTGVFNVTRNVLTVLQKAGRLDIPVYVGSTTGMVKEIVSDGFFGEDGFGNMDETLKPPLKLTHQGHAAIALGELIGSRPGKVSLLCIGPLTNLALALHIFPNILSDVQAVFILGGSYRGGGNVKPGVEFNMYADPAAASLVFAKIPDNGNNIYILPLETGEKNNFTIDWRVNKLGNIKSSTVKFLNVIERVSIRNSTIWTPFDSMAAAALMNFDLVTDTKKSYVLVEPCGEDARGAMFVDEKRTKSNVNIITGFNKTKYENLLVDVCKQNIG